MVRCSMIHSMGCHAPARQLFMATTTLVHEDSRIPRQREILRNFGVPVPRGITPHSRCKKPEAAQKPGGPVWWSRAQIHAGGRGKGGGVMLPIIDDGKARASWSRTRPALKARRSAACTSKTVPTSRRNTTCPVTDRGTQKVALIASSEGGMDIEEVAHPRPRRSLPFSSIRRWASPRRRPSRWRPPSACPALPRIRPWTSSPRSTGCYMDTDASLVEINPLNCDSKGNLMALDAKFNFDANALFRHPEIVAFRDLDEEDPAEIEASKFDLAYISLDGKHRLPGERRGLAMATMDTIKLFGGECQLPGRGRRCHPEKVTEAFKIMLKNPKVKGILVNIFGGIMKCDTIATGVITACKAVNLSVPLVVRMKGTNEELGKKMLAESGLPIIAADTMAEAATKIVAAVK